jgi:hypothetical protein
LERAVSQAAGWAAGRAPTEPAAAAAKPKLASKGKAGKRKAQSVAHRALEAAQAALGVEERLAAGARVEGMFGGQGYPDYYDYHGDWYRATVAAANPDGTYQLEYDDGDHEDRVPAHLVRPCATAGPGAAGGEASAAGAKGNQIDLAGPSDGEGGGEDSDDNDDDDEDEDEEGAWDGPFAIARQMGRQLKRARRLRERAAAGLREAGEDSADEDPEPELEWTPRVGPRAVSGGPRAPLPSLEALCCEVLAVHFEAVTELGAVPGSVRCAARVELIDATARGCAQHRRTGSDPRPPSPGAHPPRAGPGAAGHTGLGGAAAPARRRRGPHLAIQN